MKIVHHSNYLRFFEEARAAWAHAAGMLDYQNPESASRLAVLETRCQHLRPCFFGDDLEIETEVRSEGARIYFQYRIHNVTRAHISAVGMSAHAALNLELKPMKLSRELRAILEKEKWTEIWLLNS